MVENIINIKLKISYDGEKYYGWQRQPDYITVEGEIEKALLDLFGYEVDLLGSGRTDKGVHAIEQVANFHVKTKIKPEQIKFALNSRLPQQIRINESVLVDEDFHARYSGVGKTYVYQIYNCRTNSPFFRKYALFVPFNLDVEKMKEASQLILGEHDFKAFRSLNSSAKTTVRTIYDFKVEKNNKLITLEITGNGFLYNMVRIIAGTLVEIGSNKRDISCIEDALKTGNRQLLGHTLKASGLFLKKVYYRNELIINKTLDTRGSML